MFVLCFQSEKIKKGSKGDLNVLRPTLMTVVPVSQEHLRLFGILHAARTRTNTVFEDHFEEAEKYLPGIALS